MHKQTRYLVDLLGQSHIEAPSPQHVEVQRIIIRRDSRTALFQHPDARVTFPPLSLQGSARLSTAITIKENVWDRFTGTIHFTITLRAGQQQQQVFAGQLSPSRQDKDQRWMPVDIDLSAWSGQKVELSFETKASGSHAWAWAAWADPIVTDEQPPVAPVIRKSTHNHIILITSDALSQRFLGCYGNTEVATPHIDQLAREGTLFEQACSQSTSTLGAYASLLSGMSPAGHQLTTEWGRFPGGVLSLPVALSGQGYHTTLFASENELNREPFGFRQLFHQCFNAISNPAQDGALTVRAFKRYWEQRPEQPTFNWVQFFDTHPPSLPPKELITRYYAHDPEQRTFAPEMVKKVYGTESLVETERVLPLLQAGHPLPQEVYLRLQATALALQGKQSNGPDLYEHLLAVPAAARLDRSPVSFGYWLEKQLRHFDEHDQASPEFLQWMAIISREMQFIQESITGWLKGVTDFTYAIAQHQACITYFDQHIGALIDYLKQTGTYDQTTIILTSPHGEIMRYRDVAFHHHLPHPHVYDVPLIIKSPGTPAGQRIAGLTEHRDLFPSLLEALGLPHLIPQHCSGRSYWNSIRHGHAVERNWSHGFDIGSILQSAYRPPYLYVQSHAPYQVSADWYGKAGEEFLFTRTTSAEGMEAADRPDIQQELAGLLAQDE